MKKIFTKKLGGLVAIPLFMIIFAIAAIALSMIKIEAFPFEFKILTVLEVGVLAAAIFVLLIGLFMKNTIVAGIGGIFTAIALLVFNIMYMQTTSETVTNMVDTIGNYYPTINIVLTVLFGLMILLLFVHCFTSVRIRALTVLVGVIILIGHAVLMLAVVGYYAYKLVFLPGMDQLLPNLQANWQPLVFLLIEVVILIFIDLCLFVPFTFVGRKPKEQQLQYPQYGYPGYIPNQPASGGTNPVNGLNVAPVYQVFLPNGQQTTPQPQQASNVPPTHYLPPQGAINHQDKLVDSAEALKTYANLHKAGYISKEEYDRIKAELLK